MNWQRTKCSILAELKVTMWYGSSHAISIIDDDLQNSFNIYTASYDAHKWGNIHKFSFKIHEYIVLHAQVWVSMNPSLSHCTVGHPKHTVGNKQLSNPFFFLCPATGQVSGETRGATQVEGHAAQGNTCYTCCSVV